MLNGSRVTGSITLDTTSFEKASWLPQRRMVLVVTKSNTLDTTPFEEASWLLNGSVGDRNHYSGYKF